MSDTFLAPPTADSAELHTLFAPVFAAVAEGGAERENGRVLPYEQVRLVTESGFGRVRIPVEHGGFGASLRQTFELLADLTVDRIHEPYRSAAYPELPRLTGAAREAGALGAFLSGAGSTVLAFVAPGADPTPVVLALAAAAAELHLDGRTAVVAPRNAGPTISAG